eukprot:403342827
MEILKKWEKIDVRGDNYSPRTGHTIVENNGDFYLFGGADSDTRTNDLFIFSLEKKKWFKLNPKGRSMPTSRSGAQSLSYQASIYIFGGYTRKGGEYFSDIYEYKSIEDEWQQITLFYQTNEGQISENKWSCISNNPFQLSQSDKQNLISLHFVESEPKLRFGHSAVVYQNYLYVFGGWDGNVTLSDLTIFDLNLNLWVQPANIKGAVKGRYRHTAISTDTSMYIFGGIDQQQERFNDIQEYFYETQSWTRVVTIGNSPSARTFHQSINFQGYLYVIGGFDGMKRNDMYRIYLGGTKQIAQNNNNSHLDQLYNDYQKKDKIQAQIFTDDYFNNMKVGEWLKIKPQGCFITPRTGDIPMPRSGARGVGFRDCLYFFGGYQKKSGEYYNDLFYYDLNRKRWDRQIDMEGEIPSERTDHTACLYDGQLYIFGGWKKISGDGTLPLNRFGHTAVVYEHSMFIFGGWNGHDTLDDIYQYSFASNFWYELKRAKGPKPKPRYRHTAVMCGGSMIVFGGVDTDQQRFNDLFIYEIEKRRWSAIQTTGQQPQPRTFHKTIIFNNIMYVIGGFDGQRLNDLHQIALPQNLYEEDYDQMRRISRPASSASGIMQTVPSDLPIYQLEEDFKQKDYKYLNKKVALLKRQVQELSGLLKAEQENGDDCKICYSRDIDTVFLECAHRVACSKCASNSTIKKCPYCRHEIHRIVKTFNV